MDKKFRALTFCCQEAQTDCDWISAINANKRNVMTRIRPPKGIFDEKKKKEKKNQSLRYLCIDPKVVIRRDFGLRWTKQTSKC